MITAISNQYPSSCTSEGAKNNIQENIQEKPLWREF